MKKKPTWSCGAAGLFLDRNLLCVLAQPNPAPAFQTVVDQTYQGTARMGSGYSHPPVGAIGITGGAYAAPASGTLLDGRRFP